MHGNINRWEKYMIIEIILVILLIISLVFGYIQFKARLKNEKMLFQMMLKIYKAVNIMRKVDLNGAFQSHDIVGQTFVLLTTAIQELRNYFAEKIGNEEKK